MVCENVFVCFACVFLEGLQNDRKRINVVSACVLKFSCLIFYVFYNNADDILGHKYFRNRKDTQGILLQDKGRLQLDHRASVVACKVAMDM